MTVARNVSLALELAGRSKAECERRAREVLELTGLNFDSFGSRYPWQLSGGQRQRAGVARALALDPSVLLMDEPFGALDPLTRAEMQTMVKGLMDRMGKTVLVVTHDLNEALYLADRVLFMEEGCIAADLSSDEVLRSEKPQVKDYVFAVLGAVKA
jgi:osmoprotectant transport system ATP-binding protein